MSEGERIGVTDRQLRRAAADSGQASGRAAMQLELRRTAGLSHYFDVTPQHALRVPGAERLHRGFLGREAAGEMNRRRMPPHAVRDFAFSENAAREAVAVAVDRRGDAGNFRRVESESDNGHASQA